MIVDASALIAIAKEEPEARSFAVAIERAPERRMSAVTFVEAGIVADRMPDPLVTRGLDRILRDSRVEIVDVTAEQASVARQAYRDFGRGSGHPAQLNFGDCFAYALAHVTGEPLLFKGDDFVHTDIRPAVP